MSVTDRMRGGCPGPAPPQTDHPDAPHPGCPECGWEIEALYDLADAARRMPDDGAVHGTIRAKEGLACQRCMVLWPCPTAAIRDALDRLDLERLDPITGDATSDAETTP